MSKDYDFPIGKNIEPNFVSYLTDESGLVHGFADLIYFPSSEKEIVEIIKKCNRENMSVTVSGAGTGLTGGRAPLGGIVLATDKLTKITSNLKKEIWKDPILGKTFEYFFEASSNSTAEITVPVSIPILSLQKLVNGLGYFYPPDPTERQAFIGGTVITNASGARSFKCGSTREWVSKIRVVLPDGSISIHDRKIQEEFGIKEEFIIDSENKSFKIKRPNYNLPNVKKNVAGPVLKNSYQPIDLFIGSDGIFGVLTEVTLKLIRPPLKIISMILFCNEFVQALEVIKVAQSQRIKNLNPIPLSVELIDQNAVKLLQKKNGKIPGKTNTIIYLEQDTYSDKEFEQYIDFWTEILSRLSISDSWFEDSPSGIENHKNFRHSLPETVNSVVRHNGQAKLGTDYSVSIDKTKTLYELAERIGRKFETFRKKINPNDNDISHLLWAHAGDNHIHLNFLPKTDDESNFAKKLMIEMMSDVVKLGGSISAEHGLGKKVFNDKKAIFYQYSEAEIGQIVKIKQILDPQNILNIGNLI